ncbi:hypothetical protein Fmac_018764 [Flemingia macrophylla]|uniref:Uncharacterized protein n=1 Tax=Flemingia macrophylla TaxID=520843 RepID=A0ABD1M5Y2_9FABA
MNEDAKKSTAGLLTARPIPDDRKALPSTVPPVPPATRRRRSLPTLPARRRRAPPTPSEDAAAPPTPNKDSGAAHNPPPPGVGRRPLGRVGRRAPTRTAPKTLGLKTKTQDNPPKAPHQIEDEDAGHAPCMRW